jgi:hypothetical protein
MSVYDDNEKLQVEIDEIVQYFEENGPGALGNHVIVDVSHSLPFLKERTLSSGLVVPAPKAYDMEHNKEAVPHDGIVVSVGPDCELIAAGDHICLPLNNNEMWMLSWKGRNPSKKYVVMLEKSVRARF